MSWLRRLPERLDRLFRLTFDDRRLERQYRKANFENRLPQNLLAAKVAILLYLIYVPAIYAITGTEAWLMFGISVMSLSGSVFLLYAYRTGILRRYRGAILYAAAVMVGIGPVIYYIVTGNDRSLIRIDIVLPVIGIFTMYGIGFSLALLTVLTIAVVGAAAAWWAGLDTVSFLSAAYVFVSASIISAVAGYFIERTSRRLFTARLESEAFHFMVENAIDAICVFDLETLTYLYANKKAREINGFSAGSIVGKSLNDIHSEITTDKMRRIARRAAEAGTYSDIFKVYDHTHHTYLYAHIVFQTTFFNGKKALIAFSSDATSQKEKENTYRQQAQRDPLTGIYNRYRFDEYVREQMRERHHRKGTLSLIICDIDYFKKVNDTFGHLTGDRILVEVARLIESSVRKNDIVARWGGEEFAILLLDTTADEAVRVAEHIRRTIGKTRFKPVGRLHLSFGVSQLRENENYFQWFSRADQALYLAKLEGRNTVRLAA